MVRRTRRFEIGDEQVNRLTVAAKQTLIELAHEIDRSQVSDLTCRSFVELYDSLAEIGEDVEDQAYDAELLREMFENENIELNCT